MGWIAPAIAAIGSTVSTAGAAAGRTAATAGSAVGSAASSAGSAVGSAAVSAGKGAASAIASTAKSAVVDPIKNSTIGDVVGGAFGKGTVGDKAYNITSAVLKDRPPSMNPANPMSSGIPGSFARVYDGSRSQGEQTQTAQAPSFRPYSDYLSDAFSRL